MTQMIPWKLDVAPIRCDRCARRLAPAEDFSVQGCGHYCGGCALHLESMRLDSLVRAPLTTGELLGIAGLFMGAWLVIGTLGWIGWTAVQWGKQFFQ